MTRWATAIMSTMMCALLPSARLGSTSSGLETGTWPPNLHLHRAFTCVVRVMSERSPTFRRQLVRLAARPSVIVTVHPHRDRMPDDVRARTRFTRTDGTLREANVLVTLDTPTLVPELIAHEIEHVIEQLDGVDLLQRSDAAASGVTRGPRNAVFAKYIETERARIVGRLVAGEVGPVATWCASGQP